MRKLENLLPKVKYLKEPEETNTLLIYKLALNTSIIELSKKPKIFENVIFLKAIVF